MVREKDRARLRAPAGDAGMAIALRIPRPSQRDDFLLPRLLDRFQTQGDQRLNHRQRHRAIVQRRDGLDLRRWDWLVRRAVLSYSSPGWCALW